MKKKILIMGLPGSGKTTLASRLVPLLKAKWLNADEIRKKYNDWDFSDEGRIRQAKRMSNLADDLNKKNFHVVADFVCPTEQARKLYNPNEWEVYVKGGRENTGLDVLSWARKVEELGAGEILLTSMDGDGTQKGYDLKLTESVATAVNIPVIASGGAGCLDDIYNVFKSGKASAALLASLLHDKKLTLGEIKTFLLKKNLAIRP